MPQEIDDGLHRPSLVARINAWLNERWRAFVSAHGLLLTEKPPFSVAAASAIDAVQRLGHRYDQVRMGVHNLFGRPEDGFAGVTADRFGASGNDLFNRGTWAIQKEWNARFFEPEQTTARTMLKGIVTCCRSEKEEASRRGDDLLDRLATTDIEPDYRSIIYGLFREVERYLAIHLLPEASRQNPPPDLLLKLSPQSRKLLRLLWWRPLTERAAVYDHLWGDDPRGRTPDALRKAVKRLDDELSRHAASQYRVRVSGDDVVFERV